jgi:alanyl-tRNA synthetase
MSIKTELKIIADHLRSSCFLIADGVSPSNEGRGYVLRRIMRRAMRQVNKLGGTEPIMYKLVDSLIDEMATQYPELSRARDTIIDILKNEEEKFQETLDKGLKILSEAISLIDLNDKSAKLSGEIAFKLYDTFGFPLDLTQDICREKNLLINLEEFDREMELQKERARKNWSGSGEISEEKLFFDLKEKFGATNFLYHQTTKSPAKILAIFKNNHSLNSLNSIDKNSGDNIFIILDQTPFYATSGGQKGDDGNFVLASEILNENQTIDYNNIKNFVDISETKKFAGGLFAHYVADFKGSFAVGDKIFALVNNRHRQLRAQNHSATHLLHKALKEVLGSAISQKGSNVDVSQLTFDFNLNRAMTIDEIEQTEELVNFYIRQNSSVNSQEMDLQSAQNSGAVALFGEKYDNIVRVVAMGPSIELCGGTHVANTGNIGVFKIISENGVASGIRRITAKSGFFAIQHYKLQEQKLLALLDSLKIKQQFDDVKINEQDFLSNKTGFDEISFFSNENSSQIINDSQKQSLQFALEKTAKIGVNILQDFKEKEREIANLKKQIWQNIIKQISPIKLNDLHFLTHIFDKTSAKDLRDIVNEISSWEQYFQNHILLIFALDDNKINVAIKISNNLTTRFDASKLIIPIIEKLGGKGGGGKKDFAMGGGVDANKINVAIDILKNNLH